MSIASNIEKIKNELPSAVKLVAVSKFKPVESIIEAYEAGQRVFGESRPKELENKAAVLPKDIEWHFIGHLQTNKIKNVLSCAKLIESVDSIHLLDEIDRIAGEMGLKAEILLEVHISEEETKQGFSESGIVEIVKNRSLYKNVTIRGLMGMATFTEDEGVITEEFRNLRGLYDRMKDKSGWDTLSMGMSGDYPIAVREGTTIVRIGTAIFGNRQ